MSETDIVAQLNCTAGIAPEAKVYTKLLPAARTMLIEAANEIERLRDIIRRRLDCDGSNGVYHAGKHLDLTAEMRSAVTAPDILLSSSLGTMPSIAEDNLVHAASENNLPQCDQLHAVLVKENEKLRAALAPFNAWACELLDQFSDHDDDVVAVGFSDGNFVRFGDLRRARSAFAARLTEARGPSTSTAVALAA